jgi:hypothetical protein
MVPGRWHSARRRRPAIGRGPSPATLSGLGPPQVTARGVSQVSDIRRGPNLEIAARPAGVRGPWLPSRRAEAVPRHIHWRRNDAGEAPRCSTANAMLFDGNQLDGRISVSSDPSQAGLEILYFRQGSSPNLQIFASRFIETFASTINLHPRIFVVLSTGIFLSACNPVKSPHTFMPPSGSDYGVAMAEQKNRLPCSRPP